MTVLSHPKTGEKSPDGRTLAQGELLKMTDKFASGDGGWEPCPAMFVGKPLRSTETVWIRPFPALSTPSAVRNCDVPTVTAPWE